MSTYIGLPYPTDQSITTNKITVGNVVTTNGTAGKSVQFNGNRYYVNTDGSLTQYTDTGIHTTPAHNHPSSFPAQAPVTKEQIEAQIRALEMQLALWEDPEPEVAPSTCPKCQVDPVADDDYICDGCRERRKNG